MTTTTLRHRAALAGLVLGSLLLTVDDLVKPEGGDGAKGMAEAVAEAPTAWLVGWTLTMLGAAVLLPGIGALSGRVGKRGAGLTTAGIVLMGAGLIGTAALAASNLVLEPVVGGDAASAIPTIERMNESAALLVVFLLYLPGRFLGLPLLIGGLVRAGLAPMWTVVAGVGSVLVGFVGSAIVPEADAVSSVLMLLAFGGVLTHRPAAVRDDATVRAQVSQT
ncbi:hypothetical protein D0Z08_09845 [Nocardioides immobilis]|uniref:DUF4386 family protein n=1 Tax=Nocardioides immobilis TaxID=2049295 RepID=A0A417Y467_9ACTN|nr:hypothetical protein [Nocardioides immobilis]RHW27439.1 hypothetical protein D0Z08_09845 [Nocardioides immobilis]